MNSCKLFEERYRSNSSHRLKLLIHEICAGLHQRRLCLGLALRNQISHFGNASSSSFVCSRNTASKGFSALGTIRVCARASAVRNFPPQSVLLQKWCFGRRSHSRVCARTIVLPPQSFRQTDMRILVLPLSWSASLVCRAWTVRCSSAVCNPGIGDSAKALPPAWFVVRQGSNAHKQKLALQVMIACLPKSLPRHLALSEAAAR